MKAILLILAALAAIVLAVPARGDEFPGLPPDPTPDQVKALQMQRSGRKAVVTPTRAENQVQAERAAKTLAASIPAHIPAVVCTPEEALENGRRASLIRKPKEIHSATFNRVFNDHAPMKKRLAGERGQTTAQSAAHDVNHRHRP